MRAKGISQLLSRIKQYICWQFWKKPSLNKGIIWDFESENVRNKLFEWANKANLIAFQWLGRFSDNL